MIVSRTNEGDKIYLSWRENGKKEHKTVSFAPYFYVDEDSREPPSYKASKYITRDFEYVRGDWVNLNGDKLKKVIVESSFDISKAKNMFKKTYEADVPFHFRYAVDCIDEMPEYNLRKWYWDMEWQQGGEHHDKITTIVAYDNYDKQYYQWVWFPSDVEFSGDFQSTLSKTTVRYYCGDEKEMIEHFMGTMIAKDLNVKTIVKTPTQPQLNLT